MRALWTDARGLAEGGGDLRAGPTDLPRGPSEPVHLGPGSDRYVGGDDRDVVYGDGGDDTLNGGGKADQLYGGAGDDGLIGSQGNDRLHGGQGNDFLAGERGSDVLIGGRGTDALLLGRDEKADKLIFKSVNDSRPGPAHDATTIESGEDFVDLRRIDANSTTSADDAFHWIGATEFSGVAGELRYANRLLQGDVDGDGVTDFEVEFGFGFDIVVLESDILL